MDVSPIAMAVGETYQEFDGEPQESPVVHDRSPSNYFSANHPKPCMLYPVPSALIARTGEYQGTQWKSAIAQREIPV